MAEGRRHDGGRRTTTKGGEGIGAMRSWPTTMAAGDPSNPQCPLDHVPGGRNADEEGGVKMTIGGGGHQNL